MQKPGIGLLLTFVLMIVLSTYGSCLAVGIHEVAKIAERDGDLFLRSVMLEYLKQYGPPKDSLNRTLLTSLHDLKGALRDAEGTEMEPCIVLETPFQVHTVDTDFITVGGVKEDLASSIVATDEWLIPVSIYGESVARLTVAPIEGKWQVVGSSIGDFGKRINQVPLAFAPGKGGGKYVRISSVYIDFIAVEDKGETKIFLFPYAEKELDIDVNRKGPDALYQASDILPAIIQRIDANVAGSYLVSKEGVHND